MSTTIRERLEAAYDYLRAQLGESSTLRGVLVLLSLAGGWLAKLPPDVSLTIAVVLGQLLKILLPDDLPWSRKP